MLSRTQVDKWYMCYVEHMDPSKQGSHSTCIEKPGKSREFVLVFFPGLEVWNFVENLEISCKVGKIVASAPPKVF